jgi:O-antigen ligase
MTEAIVVAFIAGWLMRSVPPSGERPRLPPYARIAAWLFAALLAGSIVALGMLVRRTPGELGNVLRGLGWSYYAFTDHMGVVEGAKLLEGLALFAATLEVFGRRPAVSVQLPAVLGVSAVLAALSSALLWYGIGPDQVLARHAMIGYRFSAHVSDVNAAGSYFVLVLCLTLGMSLRERGPWRAWWIVAAAACGVGLWLGASRSAEASVAVVIPAAVVLAATSGWKASSRAMLVGAVLAVVLAGGAIRARQLERDPTYIGSGLRSQFAVSSLRVMTVHPVFGVGVGQYYYDSPLFLTPQLAWAYGSENAHNNFLQIAVETGVTGFLLLALWFFGALRPAVQRLGQAPRDWRLLGALAGVVAFLGTCLVGHPLLVSDVAAAFWLQTGLVAALGASSALNARAGAARIAQVHDARVAFRPAAVAVAVVLLLAGPGLALREPPAPVGSESVSGLYGWETAADGARFRWTQQYASLFVPADVRRVEIPVRAPMVGPLSEPVTVEVGASGTTLTRAYVTGQWSTITVDVGRPVPPLEFGRINIKTNRLSRPVLFMAGSADTRLVGIQVGEYRAVQD